MRICSRKWTRRLLKRKSAKPRKIGKSHWPSRPSPLLLRVTSFFRDVGAKDLSKARAAEEKEAARLKKAAEMAALLKEDAELAASGAVKKIVKPKKKVSMFLNSDQ